MNSSKKIILILVVMIVVLFFVLQIVGRYFVPELVQSVTPTNISTGLPQDLVGQGAPSVAATDLNGNVVDISKLFGEPIVLMFWATWNRDSVDQMTALDSYFAKAAKFPENLLVIASQQSAGVIRSYIKRGGYVLPILLDEDGSIGQAYNIKSLPTTIFLDKHGVVSDITVGNVLTPRISGWLGVSSN